MTSDERMESVKTWLLDKKPELEDIDPDMDLIENRVIDSLGFLDFVYFLEELAGRELEMSAESVDSFRTLRVIQAEIFEAGVAA